MKNNYFIIPLFIVAISYLGGRVTANGMAWYKTLTLPPIAPPGGFIGIIWTIIYFLAMISALLFWNKTEKAANDKLVKLIFIANGLLNLFWSYVFFGWHLLGWAIVEMCLLNLTTLALVLLLWKKSRLSAWLLTPYLLRVSFATYLATSIWKLN